MKKKKFEPVFSSPESFSHAMNRFEELSVLNDKLDELLLFTPGFDLLFGEYYMDSPEVKYLEKMQKKTQDHMEYLRDKILEYAKA